MGFGERHSGEFHNANEALLNDQYFRFDQSDRLALFSAPTLR